MLNSLVQSKSLYHRLMFLELAAFAAEEFSMSFFNKHFGQMVFMFNKEKNKEVAMKWAKHSLKYREALGRYQSDHLYGTNVRETN
mmetsp:Transcript_21467/g.20638  ORF Transcript_21467/g.20638 Transcript_21467/m.20638 type:complete len:85 (-) Transcript_21467:297-551(-)